MKWSAHHKNHPANVNIFYFELFGSNLEGGAMDSTKWLCRSVLLQNAVPKTIRSCTGILPTSGNRLSSQIAAELILLLRHGVWWCVKNICVLWVPSYPMCYRNQRPTPLTNATNLTKMQLQNLIQLQNASGLLQSYRNSGPTFGAYKMPNQLYGMFISNYQNYDSLQNAGDQGYDLLQSHSPWSLCTGPRLMYFVAVIPTGISTLAIETAHW